MSSPVRIYAGTQEGLFVWRSKNGSWEKVSVAFETGTIASTPAVVNAIIDALSPYGIDHLDMPLTPQRIWQAVQERKGS